MTTAAPVPHMSHPEMSDGAPPSPNRGWAASGVLAGLLGLTSIWSTMSLSGNWEQTAGNADAIPDPATADPNQTAQKQSDAEKEKQAKEGALKEPVYLQTGSFQNAADADNQKAKLALMGAEASVQQVMLQDKVWYRVRLGPFKKQDEVNSMRSELSSQGIEANIVKKD